MKAFSKSFKSDLNTSGMKERLVGSRKPCKLFHVLLLLLGNQHDQHLFHTISKLFL